MLIRVDPDHLLDVAARLNAMAGELEDVGRRLSAGWNALSASWEGQSKAEVAEVCFAMWRVLRERIEDADALARTLRWRAELFIEADEALTFPLPGLPVVRVALSAGHGRPSFLDTAGGEAALFGRADDSQRRGHAGDRPEADV